MAEEQELNSAAAVVSDDLRKEIQAVLERAYRVSADVGREIEDVLQLATDRPLNRDEAVRLLTKVIAILQEGAIRRGDAKSADILAGDVQKMVAGILGKQGSTPVPQRSEKVFHDILIPTFNGIGKQAVRPSPWFHGKEIPMMSGYVNTNDIKLWEQNERLDIHLNQFRAKYGRGPSAEELLDIMLNRLPLPGVGKGDAFEIVELARSIAINGVRKPPILDIDGTLLDGNRRVAACYFILNSDEFDLEQKKRAEHIFVWQLTQHATDDDRNRVVVSLNFEPDCKQDWPKYVKARKVAEAWQAMLAVEHPTPGPKRQSQMKRELSQRFALGPKSDQVSLFLRMVEWADEFEEYMVEERAKDPFEVKHKAELKFDYFDEFSKGAKPGTVAYTLNQEDSLKHLAFDLLFQGKFKNWNQIRDLKYVPDNEEAKDILRQARDMEIHTEDDLEEAQDKVEQALAIVHRKRAETRSLGANTRIETFVKWLEELPVKAFRDEIKPENLNSLLKALTLVQHYAEQVLSETESKTAAQPN